MPLFKPRTTFDKAFEVGIILKGLDGLAETLGGIFLLFVNPDKINHLAKLLTQSELNTNPHNFIARYIVHWAGNLTKATLLFAALYLLLHGIAKLVLVYEILHNRLWAYLGLIILTGIFIIYQGYEIIYSHSIALSLLTVFDIAVLYLTAKEYTKQRRPNPKSTDKE